MLTVINKTEDTLNFWKEDPGAYALFLKDALFCEVSEFSRIAEGVWRLVITHDDAKYVRADCYLWHKNDSDEFPGATIELRDVDHYVDKEVEKSARFEVHGPHKDCLLFSINGKYETFVFIIENGLNRKPLDPLAD